MSSVCDDSYVTAATSPTPRGAMQDDGPDAKRAKLEAPQLPPVGDPRLEQILSSLGSDVRPHFAMSAPASPLSHAKLYRLAPRRWWLIS